MNAIDVYRIAHEAGLSVRANGDRLGISPADRLTPDLHKLLSDHKADLLVFLIEAHQTTAELIATAMLICDGYGDSPAARAAMQRDCIATPLHQQPDLLDYFQGQAPNKDKA